MKVQLSRKMLHDHILGLGKTFEVEVKMIEDMTIYQSRNYSEHLINEHGTVIGRAVNRIIVPVVVDEVTYAAALHELGHAIHPVGQIRQHHQERIHDHDLKMDEELAAWEWAQGHAMVWTRKMQESKDHALRSYEVAAGRRQPTIDDLLRAVIFNDVQQPNRPSGPPKGDENPTDFVKGLKRKL